MNGASDKRYDKSEFMWRERAENGILLAVESGFLPVGAGKYQFPGGEGDFLCGPGYNCCKINTRRQMSAGLF